MNNKNIALMVGMLMIGNVSVATLYDQAVDVAGNAAKDMRHRQTEMAAVRYANHALNYGADKAGLKCLVAKDQLHVGSVNEMFSKDPLEVLNMGASAVVGLKSASCISNQVDKYVPVVENKEANALIQVSAAIGEYVAIGAADRAIAGHEQKAEDAINDAINGSLWYVVCYAARAAGYPLNGSLYETIFKK